MTNNNTITKQNEKERENDWPNSVKFIMHFFCITAEPPRGYKIRRFFSLKQSEKDYDRVEDTCLMKMLEKKT